MIRDADITERQRATLLRRIGTHQHVQSVIARHADLRLLWMAEASPVELPRRQPATPQVQPHANDDLAP
jgi:hypothetical protein